MKQACHKILRETVAKKKKESRKITTTISCQRNSLISCAYSMRTSAVRASVQRLRTRPTPFLFAATSLKHCCRNENCWRTQEHHQVVPQDRGRRLRLEQRQAEKRVGRGQGTGKSRGARVVLTYLLECEYKKLFLVHFATKFDYINTTCTVVHQVKEVMRLWVNDDNHKYERPGL